jgi:hypothetical protein
MEGDMVASNSPAPRLDASRPFGRVTEIPGVAYTQNGACYDLHGLLLSAQPAEQPAGVPPAAAGTVATEQSVCATAETPERSPAAERMHQSRKRRRTGERCITFEIRDREIDGLVDRI